jgi:tetratricopeptide (TPR) repeat protein
MRLKVRYLFAVVFVSLFALEASSQQTSQEKFNKGVTFFTAGSYKEALQVWSEIYNTGYRSASLDYNMGNAYFKLNDIPNSILFYERAYLLSPADENVNYNLQIARTLTVDRFQEIPEVFFVRWYRFVSLLLSSNKWAGLSLTVFVLCLLSLSLYIYSSGYRHKLIGFWLAISFFILSGSFLAFALQNKILVNDSRKAIIFSTLVNGKSSPDNSGTDLFVLHDGTKVTIEDEVGEWYEIRLSDGNKGWVPVNSLNII